MAPPPPPPPPPAAAAAAGLTMAVNAKRYTLAALFATFAAAVVVTAFFVVLCPAHITFSVAHASSSHRSSGTGTNPGGGGSLELSLTLAADNPSRRAKVTYESMFVDVSNSTAAPWENWVRATVTTRMPLRQPGRTAAVDATVALVADAPWIQDFTGNMTSRSFSVMVTAQARFRVAGVAWTWLYDIKVSCSPVSFFVPANAKARPARSAGGGGGGGAAGLPPVRCV